MVTNGPHQPDGRSVERRRLTALFCDLVGSTTLAAQLDPEELSITLRRFFSCCSQHIEAAGGFVAQFQGDSVVAYFGYLMASEDNAERAIRAALGIIGAVPGLRSPTCQPLQVRIGVATGLALVGDPTGGGTRLEQAVVGEVLHLAARLQSVAAPGHVVISEATKRLTGRLFICRDLGKFELKGFSRPVQAWKVVREQSAAAVLSARRERVSTALVGRDEELDLLQRHWTDAVAGRGQIVGIVGEAGIGKSRLIGELRRRLSGTAAPHLWLVGGGAQSFANTPFYAVAQMIRHGLNPTGRALPAEIQLRFGSSLIRAGIAPADVHTLVAELLPFPRRGGQAGQALPGGQRLRPAFTILADWLRAAARRTPIVIVVEDVHWADPSTLELIDHVSTLHRALPVLLICSMRPEFRHSWPRLRYDRRIVLGPVDDASLLRIAREAAGAAHTLGKDDARRIVDRAGGIPLFGIELARFVAERRERADTRDVPATLSDVLTARLDQLGPAIRLAQTMAVIDDNVPLEILAALCGRPASELRLGLATALQHRVLVETGVQTGPSYMFSHALLRDAAYLMLPRAERRELHRRVARLLSEPGLERFVGSRPELLAHHWTEAGDEERAVAAWKQAGEIFTSRRAYSEAAHAYGSAISVLEASSQSAERDRSELALRGSLADALRITHGYSAQQTVAATNRALGIARLLGDRDAQFNQLWGTWTAASSGGDFLIAAEISDRFFELAHSDGTPDRLAHAHMIQMTSRYRLGDLTGAERSFIQGLEFFDAAGFRERPSVIAQTYGNAARIAWILGNDAAAHSRIEYALAVARQNANSYDDAYSAYMAAVHTALIGDLEAAVDFASSAIRVSDERSYPQFSAIGRVALGRAKAGLGDTTQGVHLIEWGISGMAGTGARVAITMYLTWLAEAHMLAGAFPEAVTAIRAALSANPQERFYRPETVRVHGEINLHAGRTEEAARDFRDAFALASGMGATRFSDRVSSSLRRA